ncbi:MAG: endonuclease domain-containing protein [Gammaproteobacteria bacterium]|nr:endonuclease domain-containing protein [Gammaproteobacteria bacterium]
MLPYNSKLKTRSRKLRSSMTDAEIALWLKLRRKQLHGLQFYRQKPLGNFIVDFYCPAAQLVIEIDGGQHYTEDGAIRDGLRDAYLESLRLRVLRFSNIDVLTNMDGVIAAIVRHLETELKLLKTSP